MKKLFLFLIPLTVIMLCNSCKEECDDATNPECPNYVEPVVVDPCAGSHEVSAEFTIEQKVGTSPANAYFIETTGASCRLSSDAGTSDIRLYGRQDGLNYKWIIGADTIYEREYIFRFSNEFAGGIYPIKLIVSGEIDSLCFPNDNGMDTVIKYLPVVDFMDNPILGTYKIAWDSAPQDSFDVKISSHIQQIVYYDVFAHNFSNLGSIEDSCYMDVTALTYKYLGVKTDQGNNLNCRRVRGYFWLNTDNSFEAQYDLDIDPSESIGHINMQPFHAKGRRIN